MSAPQSVPSQETVERMIEQVATANAHLRGISGQLNKLDRRLYGNGQPGDIQNLQVEIRRMNERLDKLELRRTFSSGKWKGVSLSLGAASGFLVLLLKVLELAHVIGVH